MSQPPPSPPPPSDPEPLPGLDPDLVGDDQEVAGAVDEFVRRDLLARKRIHAIADQQELLRQCVDADVWRTVLAVDEAVIERWSDVVVAVARWAFEAGRRHPLPQEDVSS